MDGIFLMIIAIWLIFTARLEIVARARLAEINWIHAANVKKMEGGDFNIEPMWRAYEYGPGWVEQIFDLTKWTHAQFYPKEQA